jgi:hypothetical protein
LRVLETAHLFTAYQKLASLCFGEDAKKEWYYREGKSKGYERKLKIALLIKEAL